MGQLCVVTTGLRARLLLFLGITFPVRRPRLPHSRPGGGYTSRRIRWQIFPSCLWASGTQGCSKAQGSVTLDRAGPGPRAEAKMLYTHIHPAEQLSKAGVCPPGPCSPLTHLLSYPWPLRTAKGLGSLSRSEEPGGQASPLPTAEEGPQGRRAVPHAPPSVPIPQTPQGSESQPSSSLFLFHV